MKPCTSNRTLSKSLHLLLLLALLPFISRAQTNDCASAPTLNSYPATCGGATGGSLTSGATYTAIGGGTGCSGSTRDDVWYTFIAKSTSPTITITGSTISNTRVQVFGGVCGGTMISLDCGNTTANPTTVINGQYWIRIYSNTSNNAAGSFNICITDPAPSNNTCNNASTLTSTLNTCSAPGSGNFYAASATATAVAPCTGPVVQDLWYSFVAQTDNATITLNSIGSNVNTPRIQVFSGTCAALTSIACGVSGMAVSSLTAGSTYFVRVYTSAGTAVTTPVNSGFNICVTHEAPDAPINDECSGAITLPVNGSCSNIIMSMINATASAGAIAAPCTGTLSYDVWFKFTAVNTTTTIAASAFGTGIGASRGIQVFTGTCGGLGNLVCSGPATNPSVAPTTVVGNTYYVRVFTTGAGAAPIANGDFKICVSSTSPPPRFGNSYVNLSKKTVGGVVEKGDTLEIRMTINHTSGTLYRPRYVDNIPTNTVMLSGANDSIRIISNEGKTVRRYTPTPNVYNDAATYVPGTLPAGTYNIRMNIGFLNASPGTPADNTDSDITGATGTIVASSDRPKGGGGVLFATSFRVKVTGNPGDTIKFDVGKFIYRTSLGGSDIALSTIPYNILISTPMTLCSNSIGLNNAQEFGGSFGNGGTLNRTTDLTNPIPGYTFINVTPSQGVGDGQYAIVKNMSPRNSTNQTANKQPACGTPPAAQDCNNRMHGGFWDIDGDHTGTSNATGNLPPAASDTAGYMLEVNTDYVAAEVYRQSLTGLCPSTYYEFSAWMRNICTNCGIDTSGTATYQPGVYPNLTFILDGLDRYSTGEINVGGWIKKGFVFLTGPAQTGVTFSIRNNSQGGGGNDWVMDDISVATCLPNMRYSPSANPNVCVLNASTIYDTVASFFDNYVYYKWQKSTDGGDNYTDITTPQGPVTPTLVNGLWQYVTYYGISPWDATLANNGDIYRVVAATTVSNLGGTNCIITNGINFLTLNVLNCGTPLKTDILSFNGKLVGDMANLSWVTSKEDEPVKYKVERSTDGSNFNTVGTINGYNNLNSSINQYSFIDPVPVTGKAYYRLGLATQSGNNKYSRIIPLSVEEGKKFALVNVINPFSQVLDFDINSPVDTKIEAELLDIFGKLVKKKSFVIHNGVSQLSLTDTEVLSAGTYILRIRNNDQILTRKVLKRSL